MSCLFGSGKKLSRTNYPTSPNAPFANNFGPLTCWGWFELDDSTNYTALFSFDDAGATFYQLATNPGSTDLIYYSYTASPTGTSCAVLLNTWTFVAYSHDPGPAGGSALANTISKVYTRKVTDAALTITTFGSDGILPLAGSEPAFTFNIADETAGDEPFIGRIAAFGCTSGILSSNQLLNLSRSFTPRGVFPDNARLPLINGTSPGVDYRGVQNFTVTGTPTTGSTNPAIIY